MRELDGIRIISPGEGQLEARPTSVLRTIVAAADTGGRWSLGEVTAAPAEEVGTHLHPGDPEAIIILEGQMELRGAAGVTQVGVGDILFIPPDTEHGLRTPTGGRWLAVWPVRERVPGPRYQD